MLKTDLETVKGSNDNLLTITDLRESKEDRWNNFGVNITLKHAVEAHLSTIQNRHTKRGKGVDLCQFSSYLNKLK